MKQNIPKQIVNIAEKLKDAGYEAFLVGGCVRDLLLNKTPKDWDITTDAKPEEIINIFGTDNTFYENDYGTVSVKTGSEKESEKIVEITPYRIESEYKDARRPEFVTFTDNIHEDIKRRDFTINAIAYDPIDNVFIDDFQGQKDIKDRIIKAVDDPEKRFKEDALRMMRAIRLASELGFSIELKTMQQIANNAELLNKISKERIRDELIRMINSPNPATAIALSQKLNILKYIIPELEEGIGCFQGGVHKYDVFEHLLRSLQHAADKNYNTNVRLAALFHDIAKPRTKKEVPGKKPSFHNHEVVGAGMVYEIFERLKFPKDITKKVAKLVRWHMFFSDPDKITLSAVRRIISKVGKENIKDLLNLRICDRIGTGLQKEEPYRFRKYKSMIDIALRQPIDVSQLKITGHDIMKETKEKPSIRLRWILHSLLEEVLNDPDKNNKEYLISKAKELSNLDDNELKKLGESGIKRQKQEDEKEIRKIAKKYRVNI